jgi:hypothetical protein
MELVLCVQNDMSEGKEVVNACADGQKTARLGGQAVGVDDPLVAAQAQGSAGWQVGWARVCGRIWRERVLGMPTLHIPCRPFPSN